MSIFLIINGTTSVSITDISLEIGFQPTWSNLQAHQGYFHSNDEMLNRIWYYGEYTLQPILCPSTRVVRGHFLAMVGPIMVHWAWRHYHR